MVFSIGASETGCDLNFCHFVSFFLSSLFVMLPLYRHSRRMSIVEAQEKRKNKKILFGMAFA
jgi:hypothetical protein